MTVKGYFGKINKIALILFSMLFAVQAAHETHTPSNDTWKLDLSQCGSTKGCWFMPGNCDGSTNVAVQMVNDSQHSVSASGCDSIVTWRVQKNANGKRELVIELDTRIDDMDKNGMGKYASVGFSDDYKMGNDFVIECVGNPSGRIRAYLSFNDLTSNLRSREASHLLLSNTHGLSQDGRITCQTTYAFDGIDYDKIPENERWRFVDLTTHGYMLFARGDADSESDQLHIHYMEDGDRFPWIATQKVDVTNDQNFIKLTSAKHYDIPRSIQYQLTQAHGILMLFGWWVFAAVAMFLSRFFKPMWPDTKLCGQAVWFQLHRALLIVSLILQCAGFALIFIQSEFFFTCNHTCDDHTYALMLHTYLGVTCTAAALIQPFMALARPGPTSPNRPIFNWLHWFFGAGSFILATVTIFLSTVLGKTGLRRNWGFKPDYLMAGYIVAFIVCSLIFEIVWYCTFRKESPGPIPLSPVSGPKPPISGKVADIRQNRSFANTQTGVIIFFAIASAALCAGLSYFITNEPPH